MIKRDINKSLLIVVFCLCGCTKSQSNFPQNTKLLLLLRPRFVTIFEKSDVIFVAKMLTSSNTTFPFPSGNTCADWYGCPKSLICSIGWVNVCFTFAREHNHGLHEKAWGPLPLAAVGEYYFKVCCIFFLLLLLTIQRCTWWNKSNLHTGGWVSK